jgi:hypothetical protein
MFRKLDLFLSSGEVRETPTLLGPLERANLSYWGYLFLKNPTELGVFPCLDDGNRSSFWNVVFSSYV